MTKRKKYYPNNWEELSQAPSEFFDSCTYADFMEWKVANWELIPGTSCVIRTRSKKTGKVKEVSYKRAKPATEHLAELMQDKDLEVTVCNPSRITYLVHPQNNDK